MRDKVFGLLGIEPGEGSMVSMLLTQSVFLGIFFGAFDISAHSLFLSVFDEKMMAKGYVVSGLAGIILTSIYTRAQTRVAFRIFATVNLLVVAGITVLLWTGLLVTSSEWIIFLVFIMLGPLNILAALGFWGTTGRLFTLRQGKRLFGLIDSGLIAGIIISCYTIPVILSFNFSSHNILLVSGLSVVVATIIQVLIGRGFNLEKTDKGQVEKAGKIGFLSMIRQDRYITIMAAFVALSVMTAFFVQYSFMAVARQQYPSEEDLARFLGIFTGSMMIFTLLIKVLAFSYLLRNYGLKISLTISPLLVAVLAGAAILVGVAFGFTPAAASGFLVFFLILALGRLFSKSLKDAIESPSFKLIYQTLGERIRFAVQSAMDGTVNEIAALTSGLILAGLGMLSFVKLIHFSIVLFVIVLAWIWVAFLLYSEYRKSIRKALEEVASSAPVVQEGVLLNNRFSAGIAFRHDYYRLITGGGTPSGNSKNRWYIENLIHQTEETKDINMVPFLRKLCSDNELDPAMRLNTERAITEVEQSSSTVTGRIALARKLLAGSRVPHSAEILRLLRDNSLESKKHALYIIGKFRLKEMLPEVCGSLGDPGLEQTAASVIASFGREAAGELLRYNLSVSGNVHTSMLVLRILSKLQVDEGASFIFSRLWSPSRQIREVALKILLEMNFVPSGEERDRLHQLISEIVGIMSWNLQAKVSLFKNHNLFLLEVLEKDTLRWKNFLFGLLSVAYDRGAVSKIKENLEKDTVETGNFAIEMIDIVIDDSIKPRILALLDLVPDEDKIRNLWQFHPGEIPPYGKLIENIINRDYNLLSLWTKACTIRNIEAIGSKSISESITALLFSPESLMHEEAARLIRRSDRNIYDLVAGRIPLFVKEKLNKIINDEFHDEEFTYEKVTFLAEQFIGIAEEELIMLAEKMIHFKDFQTGATCVPGCIVWKMDDNSKRVYVNHFYGSEELRLPGGTYYILPLAAIEEFESDYPESTSYIHVYLNKIIDPVEAQN